MNVAEASTGHGHDDGDGGRSMAAVIETDSISEPADEPEDGEEPAEASAEDEKPKKRARRSPRKKKADEAQADSDSAESGEAAEPAPKAAKAASTRKRRSKKDAEETSGEEEAPETAADTAEAEEEKPKKRARRSPRKKKDDAEAAEASGGRSYSGLTIRDADPQARATLPVSALWTSDEGTMCVFTRDADLEPKRREVTGVTPSALPGVAEVGPELSGVEVVTRVSALPADVLNTC